MENINNIVTPKTPIQPIKTPITPEPQLPPQPETQIIQPTNTLITSPPIQEFIISNNNKNIKFYIIFGTILLFLLTTCYLLVFKPKETINFFTKKNTNSETSPLKPFISNFSTNNYKIATTGKVNLNGPNKGENTKWNMIFSLNNKNYYTNNGSVFRVDIDTGSYITKNTLNYSVNNNEKTYRQIDLSKQKNLIKNVYEDNFLLGLVLKEDQNRKLLWTSIGNNEWVADWEYIPENLPKGANLKVKIFINPNTNLIDSISLKVNSNDPWQDTSYKYEQISNIDEFLIIPADYKEVTN